MEFTQSSENSVESAPVAAEAAAVVPSEKRKPSNPDRRTDERGQIVEVEYFHRDEFIVPDEIDLKDKVRFPDFWVKFNTLHIKQANGDIIKVDAEFGDSDVGKWPDFVRVIIDGNSDEELSYEPDW
jgi:hypothetical protein